MLIMDASDYNTATEITSGLFIHQVSPTLSSGKADGKSQPLYPTNHQTKEIYF